MARIIYSWTGTIEDGYNATAPAIQVGSGTLKRVYFDQTGGTEAAGITFQVHGNSTKTDLLVEDTLTATEATTSYVSALATHDRSAFYWVAKCDTGAATAVGTWRIVIDTGGAPDTVERTISALTNPSDRP